MSKCCGTCVWFTPDEIKPAFGYCGAPIPISSLARDVRVNVDATDGTDCPCWQRRGMSTTEVWLAIEIKHGHWWIEEPRRHRQMDEVIEELNRLRNTYAGDLEMRIVTVTRTETREVVNG